MRGFENRYELAHLISCRLMGTITPEEEERFQKWWKESESHEKEYEIICKRLIVDLRRTEHPDLHKAWKGVWSKLPRTRRLFWSWHSGAAVCAGVILLLGLGWTLAEVERRFGRFLPHVKWLNMGGGHLMTRKGYDVEHLIALLKGFKERYPNLELIMEPGSAFAWQTGFLLTTVVDIVENHGIKTAIIDASFTCHMPDCLVMCNHDNCITIFDIDILNQL